MADWEAAELTTALFRIVLLLALIGFYIVFVELPRRRHIKESGSVNETTSLLIDDIDGNDHAKGVPPAWTRPTSAPTRSWWEYIQGYYLFFPYLWPSKDRKLQIVFVLCLILVMMQRVINLLVPGQMGHIVDRLGGKESGSPWTAIIIFIAFRFLQGSSGVLGTLRSALWIPVSQNSYREISVAAFEHVHSLSLDFHLGKKTGEVLSALRKVSSINTFLEQVTFQVVPMLIDLTVAIGFFLIKLDAYYALVIAIVTFWYIYLTIRMAQWRAGARCEMANADREGDAIK
jgi:ABC-type transport system involved in Fe-S cluster assembly fused permease/ATPase subunit